MKRYAVIGHPVAHSLSPRIHAAFAKQAGVSMAYTAIDAPDFEAALAVLHECLCEGVDSRLCGSNGFLFFAEFIAFVLNDFIDRLVFALGLF